eukprot:1628829-Alexandrium_andersonii.AAC.1
MAKGRHEKCASTHGSDTRRVAGDPQVNPIAWVVRVRRIDRPRGSTDRHRGSQIGMQAGRHARRQ